MLGDSKIFKIERNIIYEHITLTNFVIQFFVLGTLQKECIMFASFGGEERNK